MLTEQYYIEMLIPFLEFAGKQIRFVEKEYAYYGTGESAHWAVQSNFNAAGGLAILAAAAKNPALAEECRTLALKLFRCNLYTHKTGSLKNSDGAQWGGSWISILGLERMAAGQLALEPYLTPEDQEAFRKLRIFEADWMLEHYPVTAGIDGSTSDNKPESNYWNASFLYKTAMDYPDSPNQQAYLEKACALFLNSISIPSDEKSEKIYRGKPMKEWFVGANFTENYSLDHHAYMNIGYSVVTLSHAAYLYFYSKARGWELPEEAGHHVSDLWNVVRHFIFPDGRLLRIGGDTRARYCYCQMYLLPILLMMEDLTGDAALAELEYGMVGLLRKEQLFNGNGSFFGSRLDDMSWQSRYYYTRLESDPFAVLAFAADIRSRWSLPQPHAEPSKPIPVVWGDEFHGADMIKSETLVRSIVRRAGEGPMILAHPLSDSSLAEWHGNGHCQFEGHFTAARYPDFIFRKSIPGGFLNAGSINYIDAGPWGEGENAYDNIRSQAACAALPDGKSMIVLERTRVLKEHSLLSLRTIGWQVPNDLFNGRTRTFYGEDFVRELRHRSGEGVIETNSRWLNVENQITLVLGYGADTFKIHAPAYDRGNVKYRQEMSSLYLNEICGSVEFAPRVRRMPGDVLADTGYAVIAESNAEEGRKYSLKRLETEGLLRAVEFHSPDGEVWQFAANFGNTPVSWCGESVLPGQCTLRKS
ncbi:MAG: hypothetical protein IJW05_00810 [Lentisphaeria bacterium]|nr:hypothetical protein [Lentisphaeria bacterium]